MRNRDYNLDLIRVFALYTVVSVHFFLNSGFYSQDMIGFKMFIKCIELTHSGECGLFFI